ncbi:hypothetical protein [Streptomyces sp. NPDC101249]|uniref:hypothetical protein n=1 Tax=Streptomyces sp. NPDC101249 TaxID=3366140 RepID=UPI0037FEE629
MNPRTGVLTTTATICLLAGCSTSSHGGSSAPSPTASASTSSEPTADPSPTYPPGPEGDIDKKADTAGWEYDSLYATASDYVQDICDSLPDQPDNGSPAQWLAESGNMEGDGAKILTYGIPKLCPRWKSTITSAAAGTYDRWISTGEWEIKNHPSSSGKTQEAAPGTYRATGTFSNCYWERTTAAGNIIANQYVTQARTLTVTLRSGELFKNECGNFKPVK